MRLRKKFIDFNLSNFFFTVLKKQIDEHYGKYRMVWRKKISQIWMVKRPIRKVAMGQALDCRRSCHLPNLKPIEDTEPSLAPTNDKYPPKPSIMAVKIGFHTTHSKNHQNSSDLDVVRWDWDAPRLPHLWSHPNEPWAFENCRLLYNGWIFKKVNIQ